MKIKIARGCVVLATAAVFVGFLQYNVLANCDTLDGPVIQDAKLALEQGDVSPVLKWVAKEQEPEIQQAFEKTLMVRAKGDEAKQLADTYFVETVVRAFCTGVGEPCVGPIPDGDAATNITVADESLESGSSYEIVARLSEAIRKGIRTRYADVVEKKLHADENVEAGRAFAKAYVEYVRFVESVQNLAAEGLIHGPGFTEPAVEQVQQSSAEREIDRNH